MIFVQRVAPKLHGMPVSRHSALLPLNTKEPELQKNDDTTRKEESKENQSEPGFIKRFLKNFFSLPKNKLDTIHRLLRSILIAYAVAKTPATWVGLNNMTASLGYLPKTNVTLQAETRNLDFVPGVDIDNFVENHASHDLRRIISEGTISTEELRTTDLNNSGTILDTTSEINKLIGILEKHVASADKTNNKEILISAINSLNELNILNEILWGSNGLTPEDIYQTKANCQIVADLLSNSLTHENIQRLKSLIQVTSYDPNRDHLNVNYHIDSLVNLNERTVPVPYSELSKWRGARSNGRPEGPYILSYALEKELRENYIPNPYAPSSASATLLTGRNHSILMLPILSDDSIIQILQNAPNSSIKIGSYPLRSDYFGRVKELTGIGEYIPEEVTETRIIPYHEYAVKNYEYKNGQHLITLIASNPNIDETTEVTLTLEELRKEMFTITAPNETIKLVDFKTLETYLITLIALVALRKGVNLFRKKKEAVNS